MHHRAEVSCVRARAIAGLAPSAATITGSSGYLNIPHESRSRRRSECAGRARVIAVGTAAPTQRTRCYDRGGRAHAPPFADGGEQLAQSMLSELRRVADADGHEGVHLWKGAGM